MNSHKYAVIGLGFIYPRHKQAIKATGGEIVLTCDIDESKNPDYTDWIKMYNSAEFAEVDTVVICTPNYLHSVMAREAILRDKKVLCEKPLSINGTEGLYAVNTVLQLRYHPMIQGLNPQAVAVTAKMFRDDEYWRGWKGDPIKSGGILYNLGVHYIDLLIFLLGEPVKILSFELTDKIAKGEIQFEKELGIFTKGKFHIEILPTREGQMRSITVDGEKIELSDKDNLSYEDLHVKVYEEFLRGNGISYGEEKKSLYLIKKLCEFALNA